MNNSHDYFQILSLYYPKANNNKQFNVDGIKVG